MTYREIEIIDNQRKETKRATKRIYLLGKGSPNWKGGKTQIGGGYKGVLNHQHPRGVCGGYVNESFLVSEKALGKYLPPKTIVHHINGIKDDNRSENLVICQNNGYHGLLHARERAYRACGYAHWRKCAYCHEYDDPTNFHLTSERFGYHKKCRKIYDRNRNKKK